MYVCIYIYNKFLQGIKGHVRLAMPWHATLLDHHSGMLCTPRMWPLLCVRFFHHGPCGAWHRAQVREIPCVKSVFWNRFRRTSSCGEGLCIWLKPPEMLQTYMRQRELRKHGTTCVNSLNRLYSHMWRTVYSEILALLKQDDTCDF